MNEKNLEAQNVSGIHSTLEQANLSLWASIERLRGMRGASNARRRVEQAQKKVADAVIHLADAMEILGGEGE